LPITFVVKSKTAQAVDADKETLEKAAKALSVLHPRFGKDSNVQTMVETRLANAGFSGVGVKFISAEPTNAPAVQAASAISSIGGITYFYDDPNKTVNERTQWFDTYKAHFTLTCGKETKSVEIPVIVYWDADKVKQAMTEQIVQKGDTAGDDREEFRPAQGGGRQEVDAHRVDEQRPGRYHQHGEAGNGGHAL